RQLARRELLEVSAGRRFLEARFVVAVLDQREPARSLVAVTLAIEIHRSRRREAARGGTADRASLDAHEAAPNSRIRRIVVLRHWVAEIRDPWQVREAVKRCANEVRRRCREGRPN